MSYRVVPYRTITAKLTVQDDDAYGNSPHNLPVPIDYDFSPRLCGWIMER